MQETIKSSKNKNLENGISKNNMYKCPEPIMLIIGSLNAKSFSEAFYLVNKESLIIIKRQ